MYYLGTVILGMSEIEFRNCTPKKFFALVEQHAKFNSISNEYQNENQEIYRNKKEVAQKPKKVTTLRKI